MSRARFANMMNQSKLGLLKIVLLVFKKRAQRQNCKKWGVFICVTDTFAFAFLGVPFLMF